MPTEKQVISAERVANYGEVLTASKEVEAMLDLVQSESERIDSRFLEPACGNGNFLTAILRRKLETVERYYKRQISEYETQSLFALACIYAIDILPDNVEESRQRLLNQILENYYKIYKKESSFAYKKSASYILQKNIVCGDSLNGVEKITFISWSLINGCFKREEYKFKDLTSSCMDLPLFGFADGNTDKPVYQAEAVKTYPLTPVLSIGELEV